LKLQSIVPLPKPNEPPARIQIQRVTPQIDCGRYPVKRTEGDRVEVTASVFRDGHEQLGASIRYKPAGATRWQDAPLEPLGNDQWAGSFRVDRCGTWCYRIEAWVDRTASFQEELRRKVDAGQTDLASELAEGAVLLGVTELTVDAALAAPAGDRFGKTWSATYEVDVDRPLARFGGFSAYFNVPSGRRLNHSGWCFSHGWSGEHWIAKSSAISRSSFFASATRRSNSASVPSSGLIASWPPSFDPIAHGLPGSFGPAVSALFRPFRFERPIGWIGGR